MSSATSCRSSRRAPTSPAKRSTKGDAAATLPHVDEDREERAHRPRRSSTISWRWRAASRCTSEPVLLVEVVVGRARRPRAPGGRAGKTRSSPTTCGCAPIPGLLARLLHVLYDNAIQASAPRAPTIATRARAPRGRVVIEVGDDGPGVPGAIAARVFEPLVTARPGGTGLGLALARRIATAHGGSIVLVPETGATFRLELPGAERSPARPQPILTALSASPPARSRRSVHSGRPHAPDPPARRPHAQPRKRRPRAPAGPARRRHRVRAARASRRSRSTRSTPRGSGASSRASAPTRGSSSSASSGRPWTSSTRSRRRSRSTGARR